MHESHIFGVHSNVPALFYTTRVKHSAEDKSLNIEVVVHCVTALRATPQAPDSGPAWLFGFVWVRVHPSVHACQLSCVRMPRRVVTRSSRPVAWTAHILPACSLARPRTISLPVPQQGDR